MVTAAEAMNRRIPPRKQKYAPAGQDPNECFPEDRRARDATLQDGELVVNDAPATTAPNAPTGLPSTAPARLDARPPEVLFQYMWEEAI